jgi:DNA-binding GntR family transcriptional regulator
VEESVAEAANRLSSALLRRLHGAIAHFRGGHIVDNHVLICRGLHGKWGMKAQGNATGDRSMATITVDQIAERIWLSIAERRLRPGMRLKETELADIFGVSRARIRQALKALERDGLVTIETNKGAIVAEPTVEEARDIFHIRREVEQRVLERLIGRLNADKLVDLFAHIAKERAANAAGDQRAIIKLSGGFHLLLAEMTEVGFLLGLMRDLISRSSLITAAFRDSGKHNCGPDEHEEVLVHLKNGDLTKAKTAMLRHLEHVENELNLSEETKGPRSLKEALLQAL